MSAFWSKEETVAILVAKYEADLEQHGTNASQTENLTAIGKHVASEADLDSIPSAAAVRGKLNALGIYQKVEKAAGKPAGNQVRKEHYVRALANTLSLDSDKLDSLKGSTIGALTLLCESLGITDIVAAAATGYTVTPAQMVANIVTANTVDADELDELLNS